MSNDITNDDTTSGTEPNSAGRDELDPLTAARIEAYGPAWRARFTARTAPGTAA